jgi:uncharacterized protein (DUF302 family)
MLRRTNVRLLGRAMGSALPCLVEGDRRAASLSRPTAAIHPPARNASRRFGRVFINTLLEERGLMVFARIDFSGDAERAGLAMRPMQMLLFGDPKAGTPILITAPHAGLDFPLRALAWEDADGTVWVSTNAPGYLASRHGLTPDLVARVAGASALITSAAE